MGHFLSRHSRTNAEEAPEVLRLELLSQLPTSSSTSTAEQASELGLQLLSQLPVVSSSWLQSQIPLLHGERCERLFLQCPILPELFPIRTFVGRYRHTGEWFLCRARSHDCDGTFTIVWEDGTLQIGTKISQELKRMPINLSQRVDEEIAKRGLNRQHPPFRIGAEKELDNAAVSLLQNSLAKELNEPPTHNGLSVWEAAKKGDLETVLALIDRGDATPNTVEILSGGGGFSKDGNNEDQAGRSPLYWACFGGHVELVRELLARGGVDTDGAAYLAVTSRERANDDRDLMFDPDTNTYSDWVDYATTEQDSSKQQQGDKASQKDDTALIRAMLAAASATPAKRRRDMNAMRKRLPQRLYNSNADSVAGNSECIVCLNHVSSSKDGVATNNKSTCNQQEQPQGQKNVGKPIKDNAGEKGGVILSIAIPCGHICACQSCLELIRKRGDGCPLCRSAISTIVPHRT
ncbi:hypothetical protein ACA910_000995 [Epithemia clementina (nom. ined.)]